MNIRYKFLLPFLSFLVFTTCKKHENDVNLGSFYNYSLDELMELRNDLHNVSEKKALLQLDSLLVVIGKKHHDFNYYLQIQKIDNKERENWSLGIDKLLDLKELPSFNNEHPINRAFLNIELARKFRIIDDYDEFFNYLNEAIDILESEDENFDKLLCNIYYQVVTAEVLNTPKKNEAFENKMEKAADICTFSDSDNKSYTIYNLIALYYRRDKNNIKALYYYNKANNVYRKTKDFKEENLWGKEFNYSSHEKKISIFFMLDNEYPHRHYKDSIRFYFREATRKYKNKELSYDTYRNFMHSNLNSLIKIKEYDRANELIEEFDNYYRNEYFGKDKCYKLAFMNMSRYVMAREKKDYVAYRKRLIEAYEHMVSCHPKNYDYGIFWYNVKTYLSKIDESNGDFESANKWKNLEEEKVSKQPPKGKDQYKIKYENRLKLGEFWANREKAKTEKLILLEQEKIEKSRNWLIAITAITLLLILTFFFFLKLSFKNKKQNVKLNVLNTDLNKSTLQVSLQKKELEEKNIALKKKNESINKLLRQNELNLSSKTLKISTYIDSINTVVKGINVLSKTNQTIDGSDLLEIENSLKTLLEDTQVWNEYQNQVEKISPGFFNKLKEVNPDLSVNDLKHCSYIVLKLNAKEVAQLTNVSPRSVETARYRLKKKLNINKNLPKFLQQI